MENYDTINEYYGMDTLKEQYVVQNVYFKLCQNAQGEICHQRCPLCRKTIIWKNPENGVAIAALKDLGDYKIKFPISLPTFEENFKTFQSLWLSLDFNLNLLKKNVLLKYFLIF